MPDGPHAPGLPDRAGLVPGVRPPGVPEHHGHPGTAAQPAVTAPAGGGPAGPRARNTAGPVSGVVVQAGSVSGDVHIETGSRYAMPLPRQLPAAPLSLCDRQEELAVLDGLLALGDRDGPVIAVVTGRSGIGKSALVLHWMHSHAGRFGDGQLYADLGGGHAGAGETTADVQARAVRASSAAHARCPAAPPTPCPSADSTCASVPASITRPRLERAAGLFRGRDSWRVLPPGPSRRSGKRVTVGGRRMTVTFGAFRASRYQARRRPAARNGGRAREDALRAACRVPRTNVPGSRAMAGHSGADGSPTLQGYQSGPPPLHW